MLDAHPAPDALARPPLHTVTTDPHAEQAPTHPAGADSLPQKHFELQPDTLRVLMLLLSTLC